MITGENIMNSIEQTVSRMRKDAERGYAHYIDRIKELAAAHADPRFDPTRIDLYTGPVVDDYDAKGKILDTVLNFDHTYHMSDDSSVQRNGDRLVAELTPKIHEVFEDTAVADKLVKSLCNITNSHYQAILNACPNFYLGKVFPRLPDPIHYIYAMMNVGEFSDTLEDIRERFDDHLNDVEKAMRLTAEFFDNFGYACALEQRRGVRCPYTDMKAYHDKAVQFRAGEIQWYDWVDGVNLPAAKQELVDDLVMGHIQLFEKIITSPFALMRDAFLGSFFASNSVMKSGLHVLRITHPTSRNGESLAILL